MKKLLLCSLLLSLAAGAFALPSFDPFTSAVGVGNGTAYAVGSVLYHQTNAFGEGWAKWNQGNGATNNLCTNFALSYPGFPVNFPAPPASSIWMPGSLVVGTSGTGPQDALQLSRPVKADPNNLQTNKIYASFLMRITDLGNMTSGGAIYFGGFATNSGDQSVTLPGRALKLFVKGNGATAGSSTSWSLGVANNSGAGSAAFDSGGHTVTDVLFVVVDYEFGINGNPDAANLWVNPDASTFGSAPAPATAGTISIPFGTTALSNAADFYLLCRNGNTLWGSMFVADLRVGQSWAYVTGGADITNAPVSLTNLVNTSATFSVGAVSSGGALSYQWQQNGINLANGPNISGVTSSVLNISSAVSTNAGTYSVLVSTPVGTVTNSATLTVLDPQITVQPPATANQPFGGSVTLSVTAIGSGTLTYQWTKVGVGNLPNGPTGSGSTIAGAQSSSLMISTLSASDSGTYAVVVSNVYGASVTSSNVVLGVSDPAVVTPPQPQTVNYQAAASFTVTPGGTGPFTFRWLQNGSPLSDGADPLGSGATVSGATSQTLSIGGSGVTYLDSGSTYSVIVTNHLGNTVTSSAAALTVNDPYIVTQPSPATQVKASGDTATITVVASGSPTLGYQWYQGSTPLSDGTFGGTTISGSQSSPTLTISGVTVAYTGNYTVVVSGPGGAGFNVTSAAAALSVFDPVVIVNPPKSLVERAGEHVAFVVGVTGSSPAYQWKYNGNPIPGATNNAFAVPNIQTASNGTYSVVVTNIVTAPQTASATLTVSNTALLIMAPTNLLVARVGDGAQPLSAATGNTLYVDQYTANGTYVNSTQVPDEGTGQPYGTGSSNSAAMPFGSPALLVAGGGTDAPYEAMLTLSGNQEFLCLAGYCQAYPFSGADVTVASGNWRGLGTINYFGFYNLAYTNSGLYSGGNHFIRGMVTLDGVSFWTTGAAGSGTVKYVNSTVTNYANGGGVPSSTGVSAAGGRAIGVVNGPLSGFSSVSNLVFSETGATVNNGLYAATGTPEPGPSGSVAFSALLYTGSSGANVAQPGDFAFSPDNRTIYVADSRPFTSTGSFLSGGIQRWDANNLGGYSYSYTLQPVANATNGVQGLTVDFSAAATWGVGTNGAIVYATTFGASGNSLVSIIDTGSASASTVLGTAGPNQGLRGVRFGPALIPPSISPQPQSEIGFAGYSVTFSALGAGSGPFTYQWYFQAGGVGPFNIIASATNANYTINSAGNGNVGNYYVIATNPLGSTAQSQTVSLTLAARPHFTSETYNGPGNGFTLNFTGPATVGYTIWTSTDVTLPIQTGWTKLTTGTFSGGIDTALDPNGGNNPQQFYVISVP